MNSPTSLTEDFSRYFNILYAKTEVDKKQAYHVRYRVYCREFGFEPLENFPDKQEKDSYDACSHHCIIQHKSTSRPAGCVRLVPAIEGDLLPFEKFCGASLDQSFLKRLQLDRESMCEISRLAVDTAFRRRAGEERTRFGEVDAIDCSHRERRTFSLISLVAFLAATALTDLTGRRNVFAMMEPFLPRMLEKSGINFLRAGNYIDYHGLRAPYFARTEDALETMYPELRAFYNYVSHEICRQFSK